MALVKSEDAGRAAWLEAAHTVLLSDGPGAVSIAGLARLLGVSRGAFYWHFESRDALLKSLLAPLIENALPPVFSRLSKLDHDLGFIALIDSAFLPDDLCIAANQHRLALEQWAKVDRDAETAAVRLARMRRRSMGQFLARHGCSQSRARIQGALLDRTLFPFGDCAPPMDPANYATDLSEMFHLMSVRKIPSATLSRHLNHSLPRRRAAPKSFSHRSGLPD